MTMAIYECQYCGAKEKVEVWLPGGAICKPCKKAINKIRKYKLGFGWLPKGVR